METKIIFEVTNYVTITLNRKLTEEEIKGLTTGHYDEFDFPDGISEDDDRTESILDSVYENGNEVDIFDFDDDNFNEDDYDFDDDNFNEDDYDWKYG